MARLPIALLCLLRAWHMNGQPVAYRYDLNGQPVSNTSYNSSVPTALVPMYPDVVDTACSPGSYCSTGVGITTPPLRGLCVNTAAGQQCWDACNPAHTLDSYYPVANPSVAADVSEQKAIAMMVAQLRGGTHYHSCPVAQSSYAVTECVAGQRCSPPGLTWGRGMCMALTDPATQTQSNSCLDMCDTSIPIETYKAPGKAAGTLSTVQAVQNGRDPSGLTTCPGVTVWVWLWVPLLLCCLIGCCAASYVGYNFYKNRLKPQHRSYREPINDEYGEQAYVKDPSPPYAEYQDQEMPPPQTMDLMDDAGPMPVLEPQAEQLAVEAPYVAPFVEEKAGIYEGNIFDQPMLMAGYGVAPLTVAAPTTAYPVAGSNYLTSGAAAAPYPTAQGMSVAAPAFMPAYGGMQTMTPTYGAYGAYGTAYPGTPSMRIG